MRRFILKTLYFALPVIVVFILAEILLRHIPNDYTLKKKYLDDHAAEIETLILGSSHAYYGLNPEFFSGKTFNASHITQSLNYDFEILKKYQGRFNNLKTILLPVSYFTFYGKLEAGTQSWRIKNYVIYYGINKPNTLFDYSEVLSNQIHINLDRLIDYYISGNTNIYCSKLGWGTIYKSENSRNLDDTGIAAAKRHTKGDINTEKYQKIFNENKLIVYSIIKWCNERNIKLLLLTLPAYKTYRQNLNIRQLNSTTKTAELFASKYKNCKYLNLLNDPYFTERDYFDADHLSEIGAEKLSTLINDTINEWNRQTGTE